MQPIQVVARETTLCCINTIVIKRTRVSTNHLIGDIVKVGSLTSVKMTTEDNQTVACLAVNYMTAFVYCGVLRLKVPNYHWKSVAANSKCLPPMKQHSHLTDRGHVFFYSWVPELLLLIRLEKMKKNMSFWSLDYTNLHKARLCTSRATEITNEWLMLMSQPSGEHSRTTAPPKDWSLPNIMWTKQHVWRQK